MSNLLGLEGPFCVDCKYCATVTKQDPKWAKCKNPQLFQDDELRALILTKKNVSAQEVLDLLPYCTLARRNVGLAASRRCGREGVLFESGTPTHILENGSLEEKKYGVRAWFDRIFSKRK